jgi:SPP1 family predicted phage head-tail adaptor
MRPTKYNKWITVQQRADVPNDIGGWSNTWSDMFSSWASVVPVKGFKKLEYARLGYDESYEVEMRKRLINADGDCRVIYDGSGYQIISFMIDDEKVNLDIAKIRA